MQTYHMSTSCPFCHLSKKNTNVNSIQFHLTARQLNVTMWRSNIPIVSTRPNRVGWVGSQNCIQGVTFPSSFLKFQPHPHHQSHCRRHDYSFSNAHPKHWCRIGIVVSQVFHWLYCAVRIAKGIVVHGIVFCGHMFVCLFGWLVEWAYDYLWR